ncbi:hypothetical protein CCY99_02055 [Helicobacter sp. 16-1353]|uniref:metallophosphoesterase n=1 Tax=Helicobacter sp. 16-1353 TaxID=2004996 RepID=UPI000DCD6040|nr:metallophosphoesterase [Helicobacter sp. 16-1353]RAX54948.1 hypothetical protein CCY99_02055 [Helicobacter sp. 16-1353]
MNITIDTYLISDTHFGQDSIIHKEPSRNIIAGHLGYKNHFELIVDNWNRKVGDDDNILHLGDVYFKDGLSYVKKLNGNKRLIIGNNDVKRFENLKKLGWKTKNKVILKIPEKHHIREKIRLKYGEIQEKIFLNGIIVDIEKERILFSHFPVFNRKINDRFDAIRDVLDDYFRFSNCSLNIHGHTHSKDTNNRFCINLSCEKTMLSPIKLGKILKNYKE